jgi:hypothetical protein
MYIRLITRQLSTGCADVMHIHIRIHIFMVLIVETL